MPERIFDKIEKAGDKAGWVQFNIYPPGMKFLAAPSSTNDPRYLIRILRYVAALPAGSEVVEINRYGEQFWSPIGDPGAFADQLQHEYPAQ